MSTVAREKIDCKYKWDLSPIIASKNEFEKLFKEVEISSKEFAGYAGKLSDKKKLLEFLNLERDVSHKLERLFVYASMKKDENGKDSESVALVSRAGGLSSSVSAASSFATPELSSLDVTYLKSLMADKEFIDYTRSLERIIRNKAHILSAAEEKIVAQGGEVFSSFRDIFSMIDNVDIEFPETSDGKGGNVKLSHGTYSVMLSHPKQEVRLEAFQKYYSAYKKQLNTIASIYTSAVKKDWFLNKIRNFKSCKDGALFGEEIEPIVYDNLIKGVSNNLKYVHEYMALRKKIGNFKELHMCDLHFPLFEGVEIALEYEEAYKLVKEGLKVLGNDYQELLETAYTQSWIDVYENEGKRSGAYSWGAYGSHPFVLLNYTKTTHDVFTIAHELGHAMHSYYSDKNNSYEKAQYPIFLAEVASTVNEVLLLKHITATTSDVKTKKFLLSYFLDMFRTTLFRQTMFSEFESITHGMVENNDPLTVENMSANYLALNKKYYGDAVFNDDEISYEWSRIPHFYRAFYVYKYATGITSAVVIADSILNEGEKAVARYKEFLSSGGSVPPLEALKKAGVDLTTTVPFERVMKCFKDTLDELNALTK